MNYRIPRHGCARCQRWQHLGTSGWGWCDEYGQKTWYQSIRCIHYELNTEAADTIEVVMES